MIGLISLDIDHKNWDWHWNIGRINVESSSMHGNVSPFQWGEFPSFRLGEGPSHHWMFWRMGLLREGHCEGRAGRSALSGDMLKVCLCHFRVWVKICQELKMGWDGSKWKTDGIGAFLVISWHFRQEKETTYHCFSECPIWLTASCNGGDVA